MGEQDLAYFEPKSFHIVVDGWANGRKRLVIEYYCNYVDKVEAKTNSTSK